jgi:outer membrane protein OmpU
MKKLLTTAAICGLVVAANPAMADIDLELGGYFKGYGLYLDQDEPAGATTEVNSVSWLQDTEVHVGGETTLDNGLTVGFHAEMEADRETETSNNSFDVEESYLYMSSGWGRVNLGAEDGAAYLLQVEVPHGDSNIDGLRQTIFPVDYSATGLGALTGNVLATTTRVDYDQAPTGAANKITYLSPVMSGFQLGLTYIPDADNLSTNAPADTTGAANDLGDAYEAALRYETSFNNVGMTFGAGYSHVSLDELATNTLLQEDDQTVWNVGLDLDFGPFGLGVAYMEDDFGKNASNLSNKDQETFVVGADYTTGPFKIGVSYLDQENTGDLVGAVTSKGVDTKRYTGGVTYTYGPGMTFRGSITQVEHENANTVGGGDAEATSLLIGTQVNF